MTILLPAEKPARKHIVIGGGSGFIGQELTRLLRARGDLVTWISRRPGPDRITWEQLARDGIPYCDAALNLAGRHILDIRRRWTARYRHEVIASRVGTTKALVEAINRSADPPSVFISTAGKCFYGTRELGEQDTYPELDEDSEPMGMDFPAELVAQWEAAANGIDSSRIRHVRIRIGIVLGSIERKSFMGKLWPVGASRGLLPIIRLPFCLGLGAVLGTGRQPFPWIHITDMARILARAIDDCEMHGLYNAVAPGIVTNRVFTRAFAKSLRRPVIWSVPKWIVHALIGVERSSILLQGQQVRPKRTLAAGYVFQFPDIDSALDDLTEILF